MFASLAVVMITQRNVSSVSRSMMQGQLSTLPHILKMPLKASVVKVGGNPYNPVKML
jgi:hypothetical protein